MASGVLRIGLDFDNTIVCYDGLFHKVAREAGLIPADVPATKGDVRDWLRRAGKEEDWIELQGLVYGARMGEAEAFPGVGDFLAACRAAGIPAVVVSHKTRRPFKGPPCDLHEAARAWLEKQDFYSASGAGLAPDRVHFLEKKEEKLAQIGRLGCSHFVDDLPEILEEKAFPAGVEGILFDPADRHGDSPFRRVRSWAGLGALLLPGSPDWSAAARAAKAAKETSP